MLLMPRASVALLLAASLLLGLAHIALLPPWEGFDESGHYSYIQQVATTGHWTRAGDMMSKDIDEYLKAAPANENLPGEWTYYRFFGAGVDVVGRGRDMVHATPAVPRAFAPGRLGNSAAQHPPFYYYLMAPAYLMSNGWSLGAQLFLLRALSYLIAWASLAVLAIAMLRRLRDDERMTVLLPLAIGLWSLMFPMWFPEAARIGNDSLIVLFAACTLVLLDRAARRSTISDHALLGAVLGFGLITKATFLPVAAAAAVVLAVLAWTARAAPEERTRRLERLGLCLALVACISAWWYLGSLIETGSFIGSSDVAAVNAKGATLADLPKVLTRYRLVLAAWVLSVSFLWYGTWSFLQPPGISMVPFFALVAMLLVGAYRYFRERGMGATEWFALLAFGFFAAGLGYQSLILLVLTANPAPTWYLHSISPILAVLVGCGIAGAARVFWLRQPMKILFFYALVFFPAVTLLDLLFFAGCAPLIPTRRYFGFEDGVPCVMDFPRVHDNLAVLAFPDLGLALFAAGWLAALAGAIAAARYLNVLSVPSATRATGLAARA